jgi:molecular chaperone GrpE
VASKETRAKDKSAKPATAENDTDTGEFVPEQQTAPGPAAADAQDEADTSRTTSVPDDTSGSTTREVTAEDEAQEDPLVAVTRERDELQERLMRLAAEFDNFRKRTAREWQDHQKRANSDVLREMIELVDNFERALEAPTEDTAGLRRGVELIHQQLLSSLKKFGVEDISAEGMEFDPQQHEALMMVDSDGVDSQHVVQVIQKGYALNGEVLRPARVTVSR